MNDQLQKALSDLLTKANGGIDAGVSFLQAQLPDVIQQLLVWKMTSNMLWAIVWAFALFATFKMRSVMAPRFEAAKSEWTQEASALRSANASRTYSWERAELPEKNWTFMLLAYRWSFLGTVLVSLFALNDAFTAVKIFIAPKLYLIEYAASLGK